MEKCDSFERRQAVVDSIVEVFEAFNDSGVDRKYFKGRHYILYIETTGEAKEEVFLDLTSKNANGLTLKEEIMDRLSVKGFDVSSIELRHGAPEGDQDQVKRKEVEDVVLFLEETTINTSFTTVQSKVTKARITLAPGSQGALKRPKGYVIDSEHVPYNIGRVIEPGDTSNRINHIEIIDETRRVSRIQAHIDFVEPLGFVIQLDPNDSWKKHKKTKTNRTKRIRKGVAMGLDTLTSQLGLQDGDLIELSHQVTLVFNELKTTNNN